MTNLKWSKNKMAQRLKKQSANKKLEDAYKEEVVVAKMTPQVVAKMNAPTIVPELRAVTMRITPQQAATWLEGNTHNRPLRQNDVDTYASSILRGRWKLNGESIIFDDTGKLLDGQHRLWACVEANASFDSVVVSGADPQAFTTIDQGRARNAADHLFVSGVKSNYRSLVGAVATMIIRYRNNQLFSSLKIPPEQILALVAKEPEIIAWVDEACRSKALRKFTTPVAATLHLGSGTEKAKAFQFMDQWRTGADLQIGSPVLVLRQRVLSGNIPFRAYDRFYLAVSAWNAFAQGRTLYRVQTLRGDRFPSIRGEK